MTFESVLRAADRLRGVANKTPILTSRTLDARVGAAVHLKVESFQRAGAFKFRGAYNSVSSLSTEERSRGVLTYSSGNHAQAVALVGRLLEVRTTVVMPSDAPRTKLAATRGYGAEVVLYDPERTTRRQVAERMRVERDLPVIPPYDHPDVIAGQGTAALEMLEDLGELDTLLVPCGGGGLLSGCAVVAKALAPACRVVGVEPEVADDATRSFYSGKLHTVRNPPTLADGTRTPSLGKLTFPLVLEHVDAMKTVSEAQIVEAVRFLFHRLKVVVEPSGALAVAALLSGAVRDSARTGVVLSGGNVDGSTMASILTE